LPASDRRLLRVVLLGAATLASAPAVASGEEQDAPAVASDETQDVPRERSDPIVDFAAGIADRILIADNAALVAQQNHLLAWEFSAAVRPVKRWPHLWIELSYLYGGTSAPLHQVGSATLDLSLFELALLYRAPFTSHFGWLARAAPTLAAGHLSLSNSAGNNLGSQWSVQPGIEVTAGLEVTFNDAYTSKYICGLRAEAGFDWQPDFDFNDVKPPASSTPGFTPTLAPTNIGSISSSGVVGRLAIFLRF